MAKRRGKVWYTKRTYPLVGKLEKSLHTGSKRHAEYLEGILARLPSQGHGDALRAFAEGRLSAERIADAFEAQRMHDLVVRLRTESAVLEEAIEAVLATRKPDIAASTYERYETGLEHFREHAGAQTPVSEALREEFIQSFKAARLEVVARNTVNNDLSAVSVLATYAMARGWIGERPRIKRYGYKVRIRHLEREEVAVYLAALRPEFRTQMLLLLSTGLRLGESEGLRVMDIRGGHGDMRLSITDAKTLSGERYAFVPHWAAIALQRHTSTNALSGTDSCFLIKRRSVQAEHDRACSESGIPEYTIHDHRHSAAVALARSGIPLPLLQRQLGHKHIEMTMKYAQFHPSYNDVAPHFERMGEMLGLSDSGRP